MAARKVLAVSMSTPTPVLRMQLAADRLPMKTWRVMQKPPAGIPRPASAQVRGLLAILIAGSAYWGIVGNLI